MHSNLHHPVPSKWLWDLLPNILFFILLPIRYSFQRVGWLRATSKNISANWKRGFSRWTVTPIWFYSQSRYLGTCAKLMLASTFRDKLRRILGWMWEFCTIKCPESMQKNMILCSVGFAFVAKKRFVEDKTVFMYSWWSNYMKRFSQPSRSFAKFERKETKCGKKHFLFFLSKTGFRKRSFCWLTLFFFSDEQVNEVFFLFQQK